MSEKLLVYLLRQREGFPETKFYEKRLKAVSSAGFTALKKQKVLLFDQYDPEQEGYFDAKGDECMIRRTNGKYIAIAESGRGIELKPEDLNRYRFSIDPLISEIRKQSGLSGTSEVISARVHYAGEKQVLHSSVGVFIAFLDKETAEGELLGIRAKIADVDNVLILCPGYAASQVLSGKLARLNVLCLPFKGVFKGWRVDFSKVKFRKVFGKDGQKLNDQQTQDYTKEKYLCQDQLFIPGTSPRKKSNDLVVNGKKIKMPDEGFKLLMEFAVELKKGKGGYVTKVVEEGKYQPFGRLRTVLGGQVDSNKFIENNGEKRWRISTHPDFVTYDRSNLLKHPDLSVRSLAKKLP